MNFMIDLHRAAEALFLLTGVLIMVAFLVFKNSILYNFYAEVFLKLVDLPMALFAVTFAATSLRISLTHQRYGEDALIDGHYTPMPVADFLIIATALILFTVVVFVDLAIENKYNLPLLIN